jgi:arabinose-5-phosphate isomerase
LIEKNHQALKSFDEIKAVALRTLEMEASAVKHLGNFIDESFGEIVELIFRAEGRVVVAGIGKSANIAQKIVATFNSTGTPAVFMHAADAIHGDLGVVQKGDVVICISKSGNTPEVKVLVPLVKSMGNQLIALCGNVESYLAQHAHHLLNASVEQEACPHNLAPTTSTTAQLALGDALAMCVMDVRGFTSEDFARYHPGGALGKKLYTRINDLLDRSNMPSVETNTSLKEVIIEISSHRLGATAVLENGELVGVITDGDLRRMLQNDGDLNQATAADIMNKTPKTINADAMAVRGFSMMEEYNITQLVVLDEGLYAGIVHLHDILKEGIY